MRGKKRPRDEAARAVGMAQVVGISEAARRTGIPRRTVQDWFDSEEFATLRQRTKDQVAEEWWAGVQKGVQAIVREFDGDAPLRDKAVAVGVLFDKLALMRGEATSRSESKDLTHDLDPDTRKRIAEWFDQRVDTDARADAGVSEGTGAEVR